MDKAGKISALALLAFMLLLATSCEPANGKIYREFAKATTMVENLMQTAPRFANSAVSRSLSEKSSRALDGTSPVGVFYSTFKDFDLTRPDQTSAQGVDGSNLYVATYQALDALQRYAEQTALIDLPAPTLVTPTFPLGFGSTVLYTIGGEYESNWDTAIGNKATWAAQVDGTITQGLIATNSKGYSVSNDPTTSMISTGVCYIEQDTATGDLKLDNAYAVEYTAAGDCYCPRIQVEGNMTTKTFKVKAANYGTNASMALTYFKVMTVAGTNVSTGYMIAHIVSYSWPTATVITNPSIGTDGVAGTDLWYKFPGGASEATLETLTGGYANLAALIAAVGDTENYGATVTSMTPFTLSDTPKKHADFSNDNSLIIPGL